MDLTVATGTTFLLTLNYLQNAVPTTLVGATLLLTVKAVLHDQDIIDGSALFQKTKTTYGAAGDNAAAGVAVITINPTDTQNVIPGKYYYDVKIKDATGNVYELVSGRFILAGTTTNRLA